MLTKEIISGETITAFLVWFITMLLSGSSAITAIIALASNKISTFLFYLIGEHNAMV
jgi:uncharacterized membrane protein